MHDVMQYCDEHCVVLIGCSPLYCLPGFPVTDRASLELLILVLSSDCLLPLISLNVSPPFTSCPLLPFLLLSIVPHHSIHLLSFLFSPLSFILSSCFLVSNLPPLSFSLTHCSLYGIHNEGLCYITSWRCRDVELPSSSVKVPLCSHNALTCDKRWHGMCEGLPTGL